MNIERTRKAIARHHATMRKNQLHRANDVLNVSFELNIVTNTARVQIIGGHQNIFKTFSFSFDAKETVKSIKSQQKAEGYMEVYPHYQSDELEDMLEDFFGEVFEEFVNDTIMPLLNEYCGSNFSYLPDYGTHKESWRTWLNFHKSYDPMPTSFAKTTTIFCH